PGRLLRLRGPGRGHQRGPQSADPALKDSASGDRAAGGRRVSMKITKVEAIPFTIPYRKPLRFASGEVTEAEHVLVRVHTDDGLTGTAEAPPRPFTYGETQASILAIVRTVFAPQVTGLSPLEREQIRARLDRT